MNNGKKSFFRKTIEFLSPPDNWKFPVILTLGIITGLVFHILYVSNAVSYVSDDPEVCVNCHVMNPEYATWQRGSHGKVATCNDCHVPQDNIIEKLWFKANDGLRHATIFTLRLEPQVIQIKEAGKKAVQENCIRCHTNQIHPIALRAINNRSVADQTERYCWECHRETPHGKVHSLSSAPYARVPKLKPVAEWILEDKEIIK
ncbi:MAG: cytochrome c nitrite reductase small subunit [Melioribacter sp.]|uniref:cytochrome c nitrite reductase small subunit n=1 Tax=Melioribacter sp. TaxID=2052167 RepID=UPI003BEDB22D